MCDDYSSHSLIEGYGEIPYYPPGGQGGMRWQDYVYDWNLTKMVQPGRYAHTDYDFKKPKANLYANSPMPRDHAYSEYEVYDYPGEYVEVPDGEAYAKDRIREIQTKYETWTCSSNARGLAVGGMFSLTEHPRSDQNREYLVTQATHVVNSDAYESLPELVMEPLYDCSFSTIDSSESFRPARITPKPMVQGPQTAVVVGASGEEIYTDEHGRVKLQFHWDRYGSANENSSCWVRVAQVWAGRQWGGMFIPRIGQEVIVDFLEGDPDRPIVTGRVYNGSNMPPYTLPDHKTRSTIKSNSSKGGGGFNEIRLEDMAGEEQIFIHAQKDKDLRVKNIFKELVGNDKHLIVRNKQFELVDKDKHAIIKGDIFRKVEGSVFDTNDADRIEAIAGNTHQSTSGNRVVQVGGSDNLSVGANYSEEVGGKLSSKAGGEIHSKAGANYAIEGGSSVHIKGGMTVVIEAGAQLSLKVGGSFVSISPAGVDITGPMIKINSGGAAGSGSGCSPASPASVDSPDEPEEALVADDDKAGKVAEVEPKKYDLSESSPMAKSLRQAAKDGTPFCEECEKARQRQAAK